MKKVLSVILAIMLIASFVPMTFAEGECEHIFNTETLHRPKAVLSEPGYFICSLCGEQVSAAPADGIGVIRAIFDWYCLVENVYIFNKPFDSEKNEYFNREWTYLEDNIGPDEDCWYTEYEQEKVDEWVEKLVALTAECECYLKEIGAKKVIDVSEYSILSEFAIYELSYKYTGEQMNAIIHNVPEEVKAKAWASEEAADEYLRFAYKNPEKASQEEFDKTLVGMKDYMAEYKNCLDGIHNFYKAKDNFDGTHNVYCAFCQMDGEQNTSHTWGEYISNGDATTEADGTKTAKCEKCQATDTVIDEGSKIKDKTSILYRDLIELIRMFIDLIINLFK